MKKNYFFSFLTVRSCPRLLGEHVQKVSQNLTARIGKEKLFFLVPGKEKAAHSSQKNKLLVVTFERKVCFG
jgi:hypothetical protein